MDDAIQHIEGSHCLLLAKLIAQGSPSSLHTCENIKWQSNKLLPVFMLVNMTQAYLFRWFHIYSHTLISQKYQTPSNNLFPIIRDYLGNLFLFSYHPWKGYKLMHWTLDSYSFFTHKTTQSSPVAAQNFSYSWLNMQDIPVVFAA